MPAACYWRAMQRRGTKIRAWRLVPPRRAVAASLDSKRPGMHGRPVAGMSRPSFLKTSPKKKVAGPSGGKRPGAEAGEWPSSKEQGQVPGGQCQGQGTKGKCLVACYWRVVQRLDPRARSRRPVPGGLSHCLASWPLPLSRASVLGRAAGRCPGRHAGTGQPNFVKTGFKKKVAGPAGGRMPGA